MEEGRRDPFGVARENERQQAQVPSISTSRLTPIQEAIGQLFPGKREISSPLSADANARSEGKRVTRNVEGPPTARLVPLPKRGRHLPVSRLPPVSQNFRSGIRGVASLNDTAPTFKTPSLSPFPLKGPLTPLSVPGVVVHDDKCTTPGVSVTNTDRFHGGRMQELRVVHSIPRESVQENQVPLTNSEVSPATAITLYGTERARFEHAIKTFNKMLDVDNKNTDVRTWVTRFTEGNTTAHLTKEPLVPVWILVSPDAVMVIDLNGTSQHHNYAGILAPQSACFPPDGGIAFPLKDALVKGEVVLPKKSAEVKKMMMPVADQIRWGHPLAVLFLSLHDRTSIVGDICEIYLPLFMQEAYPRGVPLSGHWVSASSSTDSTRSPLVMIEKNVQELILSCMTRLTGENANVFMSDGKRLGVAQIAHHFPCQRQDKENSKSPVDKEKKEGKDESLYVQQLLLKREEKEVVKEMKGKFCSGDDNGNGEISSPWESGGRQPIFTARLFNSGVAPPDLGMTVVCRAVLVLTPQGPLELIAKPPFSLVTLKDVKMSVLRSGLGRSLRLHQSAVQFIYAPELPLLDESAVIDTRYAVLRLQTQRYASQI